jgi:hypothetical protein
MIVSSAPQAVHVWGNRHHDALYPKKMLAVLFRTFGFLTLKDFKSMMNFFPETRRGAN